MTNHIQSRYQEHAYSFELHPHINVDHIHVVSRILGHDTARPERARVLEIGCGAAPDLLAMASRFPGASFLGIDFAQSAIDTGKQIAREAGINNIELQQADLLNWSPPSGEFDYVIAHGFFSWVPDEVKERLLELCSTVLSDKGIALISYLTYPGCKQDEALRDFILMKTEGIEPLEEKTAQTRESLKFLERGWGALKNFPAASYFKQRSAMIRDKRDSFLIHDDLGHVRDPCYLMQFVEWISEHGLSYLGDTQLFTVLMENLPQKVAAELASQNLSQLETEQTLDFIINRTFRSSLVAKTETSPIQTLRASVFKDFALSCDLKEQRQKKNKSVIFSSKTLGRITVSSDLVAEFLRILTKHPHNYIPYQELLEKSKHTPSAEEIKILDEALMTMYSRGSLKALANPIKGGETIPDKPRLSALNQIYLRNFGFLASPSMETIPIPDGLRDALLQFDGTRSLNEIKSSNMGFIKKISRLGLFEDASSTL